MVMQGADARGALAQRRRASATCAASASGSSPGAIEPMAGARRVRRRLHRQGEGRRRRARPRGPRHHRAAGVHAGRRRTRGGLSRAWSRSSRGRWPPSASCRYATRRRFAPTVWAPTSRARATPGSRSPSVPARARAGDTPGPDERLRGERPAASGHGAEDRRRRLTRPALARPGPIIEPDAALVSLGSRRARRGVRLPRVRLPDAPRRPPARRRAIPGPRPSSSCGATRPTTPAKASTCGGAGCPMPVSRTT